MITFKFQGTEVELADKIYAAQLAWFHSPSQAGGWPGHNASRSRCYVCRKAAEVTAAELTRVAVTGGGQ
jgi:hypothetical protein